MDKQDLDYPECPYCGTRVRMTQEEWHVGYEQEYDIDAGDDGRTIGHPTGRDEFDGTIFTVDGEDQIEIIAEHIRDERIAHRIAALWNMAERLGLSTEEIKTKESMFSAAQEMLDALVEVKMRIEGYITTCPLCGGSAERGHKYYCLWHVANDAIRKARGEG